MRHKLLVLTVKKILQSVYIYGSYRKIKTGVPFFLDHPVDWSYVFVKFLPVDYWETTVVKMLTKYIQFDR